jgi:hypothetical protein
VFGDEASDFALAFRYDIAITDLVTLLLTNSQNGIQKAHFHPTKSRSEINK